MTMVGKAYGTTEIGTCSACGYHGPGPMHVCLKCPVGHEGKCPHHCRFCMPEECSGPPVEHGHEKELRS